MTGPEKKHTKFSRHTETKFTFFLA